MDQDEYTIVGYGVRTAEAKPHGNGGRVGVPKEWVGEEVSVVRKTDHTDTATVSPIAAVMYDSIVEENATLEDALEKVVRFQSFQDITTEIAADFNDCLTNNEDTRTTLERKANNHDNLMISNFYTDIIDAPSRTALKTTLENWM